MMMMMMMMMMIIVTANRRRKVQQRRSSTRSNRKTYNGASGSRCTVHGAQLTASWNRLYAGFCRGGKTGEPVEKPSKQSTLLGGECSHHCAIPAPLSIF